MNLRAEKIGRLYPVWVGIAWSLANLIAVFGLFGWGLPQSNWWSLITVAWIVYTWIAIADKARQDRRSRVPLSTV